MSQNQDQKDSNNANDRVMLVTIINKAVTGDNALNRLLTPI